MEDFICPKCGKRSMVKKEVETGKYQLACTKCEYKHHMLPKEDMKRGFV